MKAPILGKVGDLVPDGYEPLYIGRNPKHGDTKWGNPAKMNGNSRAERRRVIQAYKDYLRKDGAKLRDDLKELSGKFLQCHCHPQPCHGEVLIDQWWSKFKNQADEESKRRRKREQAKPYPLEDFADRVCKASKLPPIERILDSLVTTQQPSIFYGYQNVGKSTIAEVVAIVAASGKTVEGLAIDNPRKRKVLIIDLEQPLISQKKWAPILPLLKELGISVVALGDKYGPPDRDRIWATCRQAARDGFEFVVLDNLNKFFTLDVTNKVYAEQELNSLHQTVFSHFETGVAVHHTNKIGNGPLESVPEMAGSMQIGNYFQGNLVFVGRSYKDSTVRHFHHYKHKFAGDPKLTIYNEDNQLALRQVGFETGFLPLEFVSNNQSFKYWQSAPSSNDQEMWEDIKGLSKSDAVKRLQDEHGIADRYAYQKRTQLIKKFGQS